MTALLKKKRKSLLIVFCFFLMSLVKGEECSGSDNKRGSDYMSYEYLLMAVGGDKTKIDFKGPDEDGQYYVTMGSYVRACLDLQIKFERTQEGDILVKAQNKLGLNDAQASTNWQAYLQCLRDQGLLDDDGISINWERAREENKISYRYTSDKFTLDSGEESKSVKALFSSFVDGSGEVGSTGEKCYFNENFGGEGSYYLDNQKGTFLSDVQSACQESDAHRVLEFFSQLDEENVGNLSHLNKVLDDVLIHVLGGENGKAKKYYDKMTQILTSGDGWSERDIKDFYEVAQRMTEEVLNPISVRLDHLRSLYDEADLDEKEELRGRIGDLSSIIESHSIKIDSLKPFYDKIRDDEASHFRAISIHRMALKSAAYARLHPDHKDHRSLENLDERVEKGVEDFKVRELEDWRCHAQTKRGNTACLRKVQQDIRDRQVQYAKARQKYNNYLVRCQYYQGQARANSINFFGPSPVYESRKCQRKLARKRAEILSLGRSTTNYMKLRSEQNSRYHANFKPISKRCKRGDSLISAKVKAKAVGLMFPFAWEL